MDNNQFVKFLRVMPPFYGSVGNKFLQTIAKRGDLREKILYQFDKYVEEKNNKAAWFKYLASMPSDSRNSHGEFRILKYYENYPHASLEKDLVDEVLEIKNRKFIYHFLLKAPLSKNAKVKYKIGKCLDRHQNLKVKIFESATQERCAYLLSCLKSYYKHSPKKETPKTKEVHISGLLQAPQTDDDATVHKNLETSHFKNEHTKPSKSSSKTPYSKVSDDIWKTLTKLSLEHEYTVSRKTLSRFSDILACNHMNNLLSVFQKNKEMFLHANIISLGKERFILAQFPSKETLSSFLRAIDQHKIPCVIDFTQEEDINGLQRYYKPGSYDGVEILSEKNRSNTKAGFVKNTLKIIDTQSSDPSPWTFEHYRFSYWKDHGVISIQRICALVKEIDNLMKVTFEKAPFIFHCNAGVGRSNVFVAALHMFREIELKHIKTPKEALAYLTQTIWTLRVQRGPQSIQSYDQVNFLVQYSLYLLKQKNKPQSSNSE